ncbi:helix-turn-helix transcriptional regulator [Paenibacillus lautus]|uniref:helix-turn-helix domain-containing protein n=1 Tax=Paenibacillus lautus TaxID=1401 RepID=UPI00203FAE3C|nr:helix-turn-helix transcriptional regulator [Paenibacillus lautus]MCM3257051.1 helix-turn-helix transcriptional regulator [Paenibacillus lautus]
MIPTLKDLLVNFRQINGYTRGEIYNRTFISEKSIQNYENGSSDISLNSAYILGRMLGMSDYNILISYHPFENNPIIGIDISGEEKDMPEDDVMLQEINYNYYISGNGSLYLLIRDDEVLSDLSVETNIPKERLKEIKDSYYKECKVSIDEVISICKALNKRFSEIFALVAFDFVSDSNGINVAHALQRYIQKHKNPITTYEQISSGLTDNEVQYLKEMLKVYRKLNLESKV